MLCEDQRKRIVHLTGMSTYKYSVFLGELTERCKLSIHMLQNMHKSYKIQWPLLEIVYKWSPEVVRVSQH